MKLLEWKKVKYELLRDKKVKEEYSKLEPRYKVIEKIIEKRIENSITQNQLAEKSNTKQSSIARLENGDHSPSVDFLEKIAKGLNCELEINFVSKTNKLPG